MRYFICAILLYNSLFSKGYEPFLSFSASKSALVKIYSKHKILPLSGLSYHFSEKSCSSDGYVTIASSQEEMIRWRQLIAESVIGEGMACMTQRMCQSTQSDRLYSGTGCCRKISEKFKKMSTDLFNIIPTVSKEGQEQLIWSKNIVDKGNIARRYLYMMDQYDFKVEKEIKNLAVKWHEKHPVSDWEKKINRQIFKLQGTFNPYIEKL